jgi:hypothetical protein
MGKNTAGAENILPKQEAPRKSGRPPPIAMTSTTNLIQLQIDLKEHVKGEYEFRNTRNGTHVITKEMVDYLAMKSYLEKHNLLFYLLPRFRKAYQGSNPSPSPRYASGRCFQQP